MKKCIFNFVTHIPGAKMAFLLRPEMLPIRTSKANDLMSIYMELNEDERGLIAEYARLHPNELITLKKAREILGRSN